MKKRMNIEWFLARRILHGDEGRSVAVPIVRVAVAGIAMGVCVMLLSLFVVKGFKEEISGKLAGFVSDLRVEPYATVAGDNEEVEVTGPRIQGADTLVAALQRTEGVKEAYKYVERASILRSEREIHGVVARGLDSTCNLSFFGNCLVNGRLPRFGGEKATEELLLSREVARMLGVDVGDRVTAHFVQDPPRARRLTVVGVYETGFKEYDEAVVVMDGRHLTRLNDWAPGDASGVAVTVKRTGTELECREKVYDTLEEMGAEYAVRTAMDEAPEVFDWLALLNMNVWVILVLIITVAGFNMVSGLLVLILDKTTLIGVLKALGCRDVSLRKLFLYISCELILRGMVWGNALAFVLAGIQIYFRVIHLDPAVYYMSEVPINFNLWHVLLLNAGVMFVTVVMLVLPTMLVSRISPIKAIRFE